MKKFLIILNISLLIACSKNTNNTFSNAKGNVTVNNKEYPINNVYIELIHDNSFEIKITDGMLIEEEYFKNRKFRYSKNTNFIFSFRVNSQTNEIINSDTYTYKKGNLGNIDFLYNCEVDDSNLMICQSVVSFTYGYFSIYNHTRGSQTIEISNKNNEISMYFNLEDNDGKIIGSISCTPTNITIN